MSRTAPERAKIKVSSRGRNKRVYAEVGGKDVSHFHILPRRVRVGPAAEVVMAGIGGVGTERQFRRRGLARQVCRRAMEEITRDGYSCAGLFTGTGIVAHRLYRRFGYVDIAVHRHAMKLLNPQAVVRKAFSLLAESKEIADWRGRVRVDLHGYPPVYLHFARGEVRASPRRSRQVDLALTLSHTTLRLLSWGGMTLEYAEAANLLHWSGDGETWQRWLRAASSARGRFHE